MTWATGFVTPPMASKALHKECAVPGCDVSINPRARIKVCAAHMHDTVHCNCRTCIAERYRAATLAAEKVYRTPWTPTIPWEGNPV